MKVCFLIDSLEAGGAQKALIGLIQHWYKKGNIDPVLITFKSQDKDFFNINKNIKRISLNLTLKKKNLFFKIIYAIKGLLTFRKIIIKENPNAIVSFMDQANIFALLATRKIPIYVCEQVNPSKSSIIELYPPLISKILNFIRFISYSYAKKIIVLTYDSIKFFPHYLHYKITVIPNPLVITKEPSSNIKINRPAVVGIGRLEEQKNFSLLIKAFARLKDKFPNWYLYIFGEGSHRKELENLIDKFELKNRAFLPGATKTPLSILKQADIFALTSKWEGFPLILLEALSTKCAVIATDCPTGPKEIITNYQNGILVPSNNYKAFEKELKNLMSNANLRAQLAKEGIKIKDKLNINYIASLWEKTLNITKS